MNAPRAFWDSKGTNDEDEANHGLHQERETPGQVSFNEGAEIIKPLAE